MTTDKPFLILKAGSLLPLCPSFVDTFGDTEHTFLSSSGLTEHTARTVDIEAGAALPASPHEFAGIMVSGSFSGKVSPVGDALGVLIAFAFALATVVTRRYPHVRMTPATCLGAVFAALFATTQVAAFTVSSHDMVFLFAFGVINLGLGLACFATGARLVPAAIAALLGTFEPILGPIWVWLVHSEVPSMRTIVGGSVVFAALIVHIAREIARQSRPERPGVTGIPSPN